MKNNNTNTKHTRLSDVAFEYKIYRNLLNTLFQRQLNGTITFEELNLQYVVYKKVRELERILQSQRKKDIEAA